MMCGGEKILLLAIDFVRIKEGKPMVVGETEWRERTNPDGEKTTRAVK